MKKLRVIMIALMLLLPLVMSADGFGGIKVTMTDGNFAGADMNILLSEKRPVKTVDYGWVGDVKQANGGALAKLIGEGVVPVIAPLTHDGQGHILNTKADNLCDLTRGTHVK